MNVLSFIEYLVMNQSDVVKSIAKENMSKAEEIITSVQANTKDPDQHFQQSYEALFDFTKDMNLVKDDRDNLAEYWLEVYTELIY